jgi:uncharacterized protein YkwD
VLGACAFAATLLALRLQADAVGATRRAVQEIADPRIREFVQRVNQQRREAGCPPLVWSPRLAAVAQRHCEDMAARGFFGHTNPDGASPFDRLGDAWIEYSRAGENVAAGYRTAESVFQDWLKSRRHRANLDDCAYTHHGVGYFEGRWTHLFLTPSPRSGL